MSSTAGSRDALRFIRTSAPLLDALADKLAQVALLTFFTFFAGGAFSQPPYWFFALIFARDVLLLIGWIIVKRTRGRVRVVHEVHGKVASVLLFGLLVWISAGGGDNVVLVGAILISVVVVLSTTAYLMAGWEQLHKPRFD